MVSCEIMAAEPVAQERKDTQPNGTTEQHDANEQQTNQDAVETTPSYDDFKLSVMGRVIFFTLAVLTLMVSLDGTSISVALPVSHAVIRRTGTTDKL